MTKLKIPSDTSVQGDKDDDSFIIAANNDLIRKIQIIRMSYIHKTLKISKQEMEKYRSLELIKLMKNKKLFLVLDLDHTLLHNISLDELSSSEKQFFDDNVDCDDSLLRSDTCLTKLRPFVRTFLEEASQLFKLCVYTMGNRRHADKMVRLLDPDRRYFDCRVISREDCTVDRKKGLDVVLVPESVVVIVDDTESVWEKHKSNLVLLKGYHYFAASNKGSRSFSKLLEDESEVDGELALVLGILKLVHKNFFDELTMEKDVRNVMKSIWQDVYVGCPVISDMWDFLVRVFGIKKLGEMNTVGLMTCSMRKKLYTGR